MLAAALCAAGAFGLAAQTASAQSKLDVSVGKGQIIHIFPTLKYARQLGMVPESNTSCFTGPCEQLIYHGGPVMVPFLSFYVIFWSPPKLQDGVTSGTISAAYQTILKNMIAGYGGHPIAANNTQYYQTINKVTTYIDGMGGLAGAAVATNALPKGGCVDTGVPVAANCVNDAALHTEIANQMAAHGWSGGINKMFLLFLPQNEGQCTDNTSTQCAYTNYCAYHSNFTVSSLPVIYGNEPYGNLANCQVPGQPSPNGNPDADAATTAASHEMTEAITDPEPSSGWVDTSGYEIGDECAYTYGTNTWDAAKANQMWNGHFFELQEEYSNHRGTAAPCVQTGP
jgi:hypothetical protein